MKSNRQRRAEIKAKRLKRAVSLTRHRASQPLGETPPGAVAADPRALSHNNTYGLLPAYYLDRPFICRDCGTAEVWTAQQQKWWYEVAKGHIDSQAVRCRACRQRLRDQKAAQKRHMEAMAARPRHPHAAFFRRREPSGREPRWAN